MHISMMYNKYANKSKVKPLHNTAGPYKDSIFTIQDGEICFYTKLARCYSLFEMTCSIIICSFLEIFDTLPTYFSVYTGQYLQVNIITSENT